MENVLSKIEKLENKQDNGTITMNEEVILCELIKLVEWSLYE